MSQTNNAVATNLFQKVYGQKTDLQHDVPAILEAIPYSQGEKVGESYNEALVLSAESGITFGGTAVEAFNINPARAGAVRQATLQAYTTVLPSVIPWNAISRSVSSEQAFAKATVHVTDNNDSSHNRFLGIAALYGQSTALLGYVNYATATYRGVSLTTGTGTINGVAFTTGVNTTTKQILLAPGYFASGVWVGMEGCLVNQVNSSGVVVASGSLVSVDSEYGFITVDFTPVAATSTTSHRLCFDGWGSGEMPGIFKIMQNTGSLFGIDAAKFALYNGTQYSAGSALLTFNRFGKAVAAAVNRGGLGGKKRKASLAVLVNPRTWHSLLNEQAALRAYDKSYSPSEVIQGADAIVFHHMGIKSEFIADPVIMEGFALALNRPDWVRSGSADVQMGVPGIDEDLLFPLYQQAWMAFRTYADQYVFCRAPARSILITGINDEASS